MHAANSGKLVPIAIRVKPIIISSTLNWRARDTAPLIKIFAETISKANPIKKYVTALFKRQWGANLIKYDGVQLPGGVNLNGRQLFDDATNELTQIEEQMQLRNELPVDMMVGAGPF